MEIEKRNMEMGGCGEWKPNDGFHLIHRNDN